MRFKCQINGEELPDNIFLSEKEYVPKRNFLNILNKRPLLTPVYYDNADTMRELKLKFFIDGITNDDIYKAILFFEKLFNKRLIISYIGDNDIEDESYITNMECEYLDITGKAYINCSFLTLTSFGKIEVTDMRWLDRAVGAKHPIERIDCTSVTLASLYPLIIRPFGITIQAPCTVDFVGGIEIFKSNRANAISNVFVQPYFFKRDKNVSFSDKNKDIITYPYTDNEISGIKYSVRLRVPLT